MDSDTTTTDDTATDDTAAPEATETPDAKPAEDPRISKANREAADYRKKLRAVEAELEKARQATMSEAEKVSAEAEKRGREAAAVEFGQRLVRAEFRAEAGGRVKDLDSVLDDLNLAKFIGEDGEPDTRAIRRAVARLAPAEDDTRRPGPRPDLSQGGSRNQTALNSDELTDALTRAVGA